MAYTDEELLDDLRRVSEKLGKSPSYNEYNEHGNHYATTLSDRFGSWNNAKTAAGLSQHTHPEDEELLEDLKRVAEKIGKSPTTTEYRAHGRHSDGVFQDRFGSWNNAKDAAGLSKNQIKGITDEQVLEDLRRVAKKLDKSPTRREYDEHGVYAPETPIRKFDGWNTSKAAAGLSQHPTPEDRQLENEELLRDLRRVSEEIDESPTVRQYRRKGDYYYQTLVSRFGGWNRAKDTAGLSRNTDFDYTTEDLLKHIREEAVGTEINDVIEFLSGLDKAGYVDRYDNHWEPIIRAGLKPTKHTPLSEQDYDSYIQTAIDAYYPSISLYGLLRAFTGMPKKVLYEFNLDWVSRINSEVQPPLVRVPSKHIFSDDDWELILPRHYTAGSGDKKSTQLKPLLKWMDDTGYTVQTNPDKHGSFPPLTIIDRTNLNASSINLRSTVVAHLARKGVSRFEIEMQVGAKKTHWQRSIEDYFLYLYQFEDYSHPDYEPSGVYLDPDSGDVTKIESESN